MNETKKKCFVIMPFSKTKEHHSEEYWNRHFYFFLKPLIERNQQLEAFRSEPLRADIATQIITNLFTANVVVADLTDYNPNVLWELGVRQSFKPCTVTIAEVGTQIPFHFSHKAMLYYNGEHLDNTQFEEKFVESLKDCLEKPEESDSPVLDALGGRGTLYAIIHEDENDRRIMALKDEFVKNRICYEKMIDVCGKNKLLRQQQQKPVAMEGLLSAPAAEFLLINRYLDRDIGFYLKVMAYVELTNNFKAFVHKWVENPVAIENWVLDGKDKDDKIISNYYEALKEL